MGVLSTPTAETEGLESTIAFHHARIKSKINVDFFRLSDDETYLSNAMFL